jgi:hypothetical protein
MKKANDELKNAGILDDVRLLLQVHDELVYEVKEDKIDQAIKIIEKAMKNARDCDFKPRSRGRSEKSCRIWSEGIFYKIKYADYRASFSYKKGRG